MFELQQKSAKRFSVVIPYFQRIANMQLVLAALSDQDLPRDQFEVLIGSMEYSEQLLQSIKLLSDKLDVRVVMTNEPWNVARARNLALRHVEGEVVLLLDADMLLPSGFLRRMYSTYYESGQRQVVVCQMLNYDEGKDVATSASREYDFYRQHYLQTEDRSGFPEDIRWTIEQKIPWALCWTAAVAFPRSSLEESDLYFDTDFKGWGVEDTEWGYRLYRAGLPILFANDLWAIHLPHPRNVTKNHQDEARNFRLFLSKWPNVETEIVAAFGDVGSNVQFDTIHEYTSQVCEADKEMCVAEFRLDDEATLAIGVVRNSSGDICNQEAQRLLSGITDFKLLPLYGFKLPYEDGTISRAYILPAVSAASEHMTKRIRDEAQRVSRQTISS